MAQSLQTPTIVATCPRCGTSQTTINVVGAVRDVEKGNGSWAVFGHCRTCCKPAMFDLYSEVTTSSPLGDNYYGTVLNVHFSVSVSPPIVQTAMTCPAYVPPAVSLVFDEGAQCVAFSSYDAAGAMFRKTIDVATRSLIGLEPESVDKGDRNYISWKTAKDLRLRLDWLFDLGKLPTDLRSLVSCVHQDGNDAAHSSETIGVEGALDLQDFSAEILETIFTRPGQIAANVERRDRRRK